MKKFTITILFILLIISITYSQHSNRLFYGGYSGSTRIDLMDEYDRSDANYYIGGEDLFSKPSDGKLFYHLNSDGSYYKGAVISDKDWDRLIIGLIKYNSNDNYILNSEKFYEIGSTGYGVSNFMRPVAVAVTYYDPDEICIYVADEMNNRIQRCIFNLTNGSTRLWASLATDELDYPSDVEIDHKNDLNPANDELWVVDSRNNRIVRINYSGTIVDEYGTNGTGTGNFRQPVSIALYRYLDEVYDERIVVSDNGNNRLVSLSYIDDTFNWLTEVSISEPNLISSIQFDQISKTLYAVDQYNSKIYKYVYNPNYPFIFEKCGEYGGYGTGNHQLKHPVAIHPIVPMNKGGYTYGLNYVGIIEEWSDNSGIKIGYEGVDITDLDVTVTPEMNRMRYECKMPVGIGYVTATIKGGPENNVVKTIMNDEIFHDDHDIYYWYGENDYGNYVSAGTYTLEMSIETYWDRWDKLTLQQTFDIVPGGPYAPVPYTTSFGSSLDQYWDKSFSTTGRVRTTQNYGPHSGSYHLVMSSIIDPLPGFYYTNWANLKLDFTGVSEATELSFWWKDFGDENHDQDAVYFSDNAGSSWVKIYSFSPASNPNNIWKKVTLDMNSITQYYGLSLSDIFYIKFQQRDDRSVNNGDGIAIDDVALTIKGGSEYYSSPIYKDYLEGIVPKNELLQNYPNPFSSITSINYALEEDSRVLLEIYDITARKIITLVDADQMQGVKTVNWDGTNNMGEKVPEGVYFCKIFMNGTNSKYLNSIPILKVK